MASKILISAFVLQLVLYCGGVSVQVQEDHLPDDAVVMLQAQMEMKKGEARQAKLAPAVEEEEESYGLKASCSTSDTCFGGQPPVSVKAQEKVSQALETKPEADQASISVTGDSDTAALTPEASTFAPIIGTVLQAVACLLIMDVLRRGAGSKRTPGKVPTKAAAPVASAPTASSSALLAAALAGDEGAFEAEICGRAQASQVDSWGCTVLHYAAKGGSAQIVKRLLELGAWVEALDVWDETPLHIAARAGHSEVCEALLTAGALIDALNAEENTPLVVAGRSDKEAVCRLLIGHGAGVAGLDADMVPSLVAGLLQQ